MPPITAHRRQYGFKAADVSGTTGEFEAYVSIFGNVDDYGDRVVKGAFDQAIKDSGGIWPMVYSHGWRTIPIGKTTKAQETDTGLLVRGELLIADNADARALYAAMKAGVPLEFSFSYTIKSSRWVTEDEREILELIELGVDEVGPCLIGANRETHLVGVKSHEAAAALAGVRPSKAAPGPNPDPAEGDPGTQTSPQDADDTAGRKALNPLTAADVRRWARI